MVKKNLFSMLTLVAIVLLVAACASLQSNTTRLAKHPTAAELDALPTNCLDCHERGDALRYERYVHNVDFGKSHSPEATQGEAICAMCHQTSFCNDCHATRVELKPSLKNPSDTYRNMPHRGDYLSRHRIDGRLDPTSCLRCHGNPKTAKTCVSCHG
jgi:hypothetical protein